jgi:hypothetical protein
MSLLKEVTEEADIQFALRHLTFLLQVVPDSAVHPRSTPGQEERRFSLVKEKQADPYEVDITVEGTPFASCNSVPPSISSNNDSITTSESIERRGSF